MGRQTGWRNRSNGATPWQLSLGYPPETPLAIVKHAGYADQEEVIQATLGTILERVGSEQLPFEYNSLGPVLRGEGWGEGRNGKRGSYFVSVTT